MKRTLITITSCLLLTGAISLAGGCESSPKTDAEVQANQQLNKAEWNALVAEADATIEMFKNQDPGMQTFFDEAAGFAVLPTIAKGGLIVGGAMGKGVVYKGGKAVGYTKLTQGTIGLQIGGQTFSEIIFLQDTAAMDYF